MPELPEVETICRGIRPHLERRSIEQINYSGKQLRFPVALEEMKRTILHQPITSVTRRAKYLIIRLETQSMLLIHLGMTGNLGIFDPALPPSKHCHLRFLLSDGRELRYTDIRRFGSIRVLNPTEAETIEETLLSTTGPEPLDDKFTGKYLRQKANKRSIPVKTFIMTNSVVAGVGNIYANESLFRAGLHPGRKVNTLNKHQWDTLAKSIKNVLEHAIECGGSTISDYVNADQESGYFQMNFQVYGKSGEPCCQCKAILQKKTIGGRASFYCPTCQKK